ncbi:Alpha/Beta hydrolase protein [Coprinopsis sp. MPI-PUGE-AT-0042]|nr:Alpha/Beta hydrolase protein [Coprinopsis sp. MPI-PUGE-AT-0042]
MNKGDSPLLAGPIGDCCAKSVKHSGEATGKTIDIDGIPTYLAEPPIEPKGKKQVLLFFSDVYGPLSLNNQLLQDFFASNGLFLLRCDAICSTVRLKSLTCFYVLGLDYFFGDTMDKYVGKPDAERDAWLNRIREIAEEAWPRWVEAVRKIYGDDATYTAAGYCFGASPIMELAATDKIVAAAFAHPALVTEDHFRNVKKPLLMSCAEDDFTFSTESRRRGVDILTETKAVYYIQVFGGVTHGFATKGDISVPHIRHAKEESARSVVNWFIRWGEGK